MVVERVSLLTPPCCWAATYFVLLRFYNGLGACSTPTSHLPLVLEVVWAGLKKKEGKGVKSVLGWVAWMERERLGEHAAWKRGFLCL